MKSARAMFIDVDIPDDDPLRPAKIYVTTAAPGVRIFEKDDSIDWESDFIWLVVTNEEDGLDFKVKQTIDGQKEIQTFFKDRELDDTSKLRTFLQQDPQWDVYKLRAIVLLQYRIETQIEVLREVGDPERSASIREGPWELARRLRKLELDMLERAGSALQEQVRTCPALVAFALQGRTTWSDILIAQQLRGPRIPSRKDTLIRCPRIEDDISVC